MTEISSRGLVYPSENITEMNDFYIKEEFAAPGYKGPGSCWNCKRFSPKMWTGNFYTEATPRYRCQNCAFGTGMKAYTISTLKTYHLYYQVVGNIFKCPYKVCDRQNLSFQQFYSKSCCKNILDPSSLEYNDSSIVDHDYLQKISQLHKKSGVLKEQARLRFEESKKKMEEDEKELKKKEEEFQKIEDKMAIYFSLALQNITQGKPVEEDSRLICKICREKYNDEDRVQYVLSCPHSLCEKCLKTLPEKICPNCRSPFTDDQIKKLCY